MPSTAPVVLIGGGHAAAAFANSVRRAGYAGPVVLVSDEPVLPYHRPPLSKKYLADSLPVEQILIRAAAWYAEQQIDLRLNVRAEAIDREARRVRLSDGTQLDYSQLVLLTGATPRRLPAAIGGELRHVLPMRSLAHADALAPHLVAGQRLLVVGGGYIGLEAAAVAATRGLQVTLLEAAPRILQRVAAPATSDWFRQLHRSHGVDVREGVALRRLLADGDRVCGAELEDGSRIDADVVLVGIGVTPNVELAQACGLHVDNGIVVDAHCRTSDPLILAAGDCCSFDYRGQHTRLESVQNANDQARCAVATILGAPEPYRALPWFWSDQGSMRLQMAGLMPAASSAEVTRHRRPGATPASFSLLHYRGERLLCVESVNAPLDHMAARKLLEAGRSPAPALACDPAVPLKQHL